MRELSAFGQDLLNKMTRLFEFWICNFVCQLSKHKMLSKHIFCEKKVTVGNIGWPWLSQYGRNLFLFQKEHFIQKLGNSGERDATCLSSDGERWFRTINLRHFKLAKCRPLPKKKNYLFKFFIKIYKIKKEKQRQKYLCIVWATLACYYIHVHVWSIILLYETSPFCTVSFKSIGMSIDWTFKFVPL